MAPDELPELVDILYHEWVDVIAPSFDVAVLYDILELRYEVLMVDVDPVHGFLEVEMILVFDDGDDVMPIVASSLLDIVRA